MTPLFLGLAGTHLTEAERSLFQSLDPAGFILFARNVESLDQVRALTDALCDLAGREELPVLIDQEGGRVARLKPPLVPAFPPAATFGMAWEKAPATAMAAARTNAEAIGTILASVGITVDCLPLLDVPQAGAHDIIGDRAFGHDPLAVAALGRATLDGLQRSGVVGVVKHIPGHGRAGADSHLDLPVVEATDEELEADLFPFRRLADAPMAMTAHILYPAWDGELCATLSPTIIGDIIRRRIGFDGLLMSDDLGMHALAHQPGADQMGRRAARALEAGCDIALHCSGNFKEMEEIAAQVPAMTAEASARLARAMAWRHRARVPRAGDAEAPGQLIARRDALLEAAG